MKKKIYIRVHLEDVLFEVLNKTHYVGKSVEAANEASYQTAAQMMASLDDEDLMQLRRSIQDAASRIKTVFGEYLAEAKTSACNRLGTAVMSSDGELLYVFNLPSNFNSASVDALEEGIHGYIVASVIADWFTVTNVSSVAPFEQRMAICIENAKRALYKRSRPSLPSYYDAEDELGTVATDPCKKSAGEGGTTMPGLPGTHPYES